VQEHRLKAGKSSACPDTYSLCPSGQVQFSGLSFPARRVVPEMDPDHLAALCQTEDPVVGLLHPLCRQGCL